MEDTIQKIIDLLYKIEAVANDEEFQQEINDAIISMEGAKDRLTAIEEEIEEAGRILDTI